MAHSRRPHQRRYPKINGYRKPGMVDVSGSEVGDGEGKPESCCCLLVALVFVLFGLMPYIVLALDDLRVWLNK
jgi:hypothetical protein